jgi:hypothetical protein
MPENNTANSPRWNRGIGIRNLKFLFDSFDLAAGKEE